MDSIEERVCEKILSEFPSKVAWKILISFRNAFFLFSKLREREKEFEYARKYMNYWLPILREFSPELARKIQILLSLF